MNMRVEHHWVLMALFLSNTVQYGDIFTSEFDSGNIFQNIDG